MGLKMGKAGFIVLECLAKLIKPFLPFSFFFSSPVPMKYEIGYRNSIDLDAEQTEARYDQGMLSDIMNDDRVELQKAESCVADNFKYDHGQKVRLWAKEIEMNGRKGGFVGGK